MSFCLVFVYVCVSLLGLLGFCLANGFLGHRCCLTDCFQTISWRIPRAGHLGRRESVDGRQAAKLLSFRCLASLLRFYRRSSQPCGEAECLPHNEFFAEV